VDGVNPNEHRRRATREGFTDAKGAATDAGTEIIDVAEYYGSENAATATLIRYIQQNIRRYNPTYRGPRAD
jgi:diketogulonate reductase-like aldo/keto reductase